jgi:hemoglobin
MSNYLCIGVVIIVIIVFIIWYKKQKKDSTLYDKLGGIYSIAAVVNDFSDRIIADPLVGKESPNTYLRDWSNNKLNRLPGLKFMRTLWLASLTGGPFDYHGTVPGACPFSLENAHKKFHINSAEFDRVGEILTESLQSAGVDPQIISSVISAFMAHKDEVTKAIAPTRC